MRAPQRDERGFTLIEVMVSLMITAVVMTAMAALVISSLQTIAQARQRQVATGLATEALERLRALPYDSVTQPDGSAPQSGLAYVTTSGGVTRFVPTGIIPGFDQVLVPNNPGGGWLGSGRYEDVTVGEVSYRVSTYVTKPPTTAAGVQTFTATAVVTWRSAVTKGTRTVAEQSTLYSPAGCLSTAQSPFAAPCQAYFTAQAGQALSGLSVTNPSVLGDPIPGFGAERLEISFARATTNLLVEQTASGTADARTSGVSTLGPSGTQGSASATVSVDSDPSSTPGQSQSATTTSYASSGLSTSGAAGTLRVVPGASNSGASASAIAASTSTCVGTAGTGLATGPATALLPCSSASMRPDGTATLVYQPAWGATTPITLASFGGSTTTGRSVAAMLSASNIDACTSGSGPGTTGCAHAAVNRTIGAQQLGLVSGASSVPPGLTGALVTVSGITESARTEEGQGGRVPAYTRTGTLQVWNGSGYTTIDLASFANPAGTPAQQAVVIPPTQLAYPGPAGGVVLTYEGRVAVQRPTLERTQTGATRTGNLTTDCKTNACTSQLNGASGVTVTLEVTIERGGAVVGQLGMAADLGGLVSQSSYKAAANA